MTPLYSMYRLQFGFSALTLTLIFAAYVVAIILAMLLFGPLADAFGRRRIILISVLAAVLAASSTPWLFGVRIVQGIAQGAIGGVGAAALIELGSDIRKSALVNAMALSGGLALGTLYAGVNGTNQLDESSVYALDASTGVQSTTQYTLAGGTPQLSVVGGILYVGTDASLVAIDPEHHQQIWHKSAADLGFNANLGPIMGFSVAQGIAYVTLQNGHASYCMALSASNGGKQWQTPPITVTSLGSGGSGGIGTPFASNGMVYFAVTGTSGAVFAYNERGNQVWSYKTGELLVQRTPLLRGNILYITEDKIGVGVNASDQTNLVALDATGGNVHWHMKPVPGVGTSATVLDGIVYVATGYAQNANITYAFGASTGASLWQVHLSSNPFTLVSANTN